MQNSNEALPSIILTGRALLVKTLYNSWTAWNILIKFCILIHIYIIYRLPYTSLFWWTRLCWASVENLGSASENAHNSWTLWYIHFKFCILMYFNIVQPLPCKTVTRLCRASFWPVTNLLSIHSIWQRKPICLHSTRVVHSTVSWLSLYWGFRNFADVRCRLLFGLSGLMWFMVTFGIRFNRSILVYKRKTCSPHS